MYNFTKTLILGLAITGCATVNVPTVETLMRDTYEQACRDTVTSKAQELVLENIESCAKATNNFDPTSVKSYRSDFELVVRRREVRETK